MQHPDALTKLTLREVEPFKAGLADMVEEKLKEHLELDQVAKMSFNENPFGTSPKAREAIKTALDKLHVYHDVDESGLKEKLCRLHEVKPEQVLLGNGADEVVHMAATAFLKEGDEAIIPQPTYLQYEVSTLVMGASPVYVPPREYKVDTEGVLSKVTPQTKMIFMCNPNNPTGTMLSRDEMKAFLEAVPDHVVVLIDEAYFEYVTDPDYPSSTEFLEMGKLIMGVRTFSKIHGLAALRVGYGIGPKALMHTMARTRMQVNVNYLGLVAAKASLEDVDHIKKVREQTEEEKKFLYEVFSSLGFEYVPSYGNFIFVDIDTDSEAAALQLAAGGVVVRPGYLFDFPSFLRVTVGTREQNTSLINGLKNL